MYKIAICDVDRAYRGRVKKIIVDEGVIAVDDIRFYEYCSGVELLEDVNILHHLIFIDNRMPGLDGNKTIQQLRKENKDAVVVFCSRYFEPTADSINIGQLFRYIMKDANDRYLKREMSAILLKVKQCSQRYSVTITSVGRVRRVPVEKILYICLAKRGCHMYVDESGSVKEMRCRESLPDLYGELADKGFAYAHNSYIVNLEKVEAIEKNIVILKDGIQLNISRSKRKQFEDKLLELFYDYGTGMQKLPGKSLFLPGEL